ncbi:MAG: hypothetical protein L6Q37_07545 [Bdellovibrionaceae bacterium]|nr:hypothetical protein [Bacteriovoracaceae bacterium]MCK6598203.1 hypothetical protein [Pseudobdellovibrionaceae bacterium]NUM58425.1 hypothetical protein [Pseudobdellovibrionaceae bacterium]
MNSKLLIIPPITLLFTLFSNAVYSIPPGEYLAKNGRGTLLVTARKKGQYFKINTYGANGHSCFSEGIAENNVNIEKDDLDKTCTITFIEKDDLIQVSTPEDSCQGNCGARASINHDFFKVDDICTSKNKTKKLKLFKKYYSKKTFALAEKTLRTVYDSCRSYMSIFEEMEIINDLAVTYKNLNKKDECLNIIKPFDEQADMSETQIKENYFPAEAETLAPIAKKLKFNRDLCQSLK